jgi:hypothetical protein
MGALQDVALRRILRSLSRGFKRLVWNDEIAQEDGKNNKRAAYRKSGPFFFLVRHGDSSPKPFKGAVKKSATCDKTSEELQSRKPGALAR